MEPFKPKFSPGSDNDKLRKLMRRTGRTAWSFSTLAGHTCPFARICLVKAVRTPQGMRKQRGPETEVDCFSASQEALYPTLYAQRAHNSRLIAIASKSVEEAVACIIDNLPMAAGILRLNVGGDFQTLAYFDAWAEAARRVPRILFYGYTKSLPFLVKRWASLPGNFVFTASRGGTHDHLIDEHDLREAVIVGTEYEARKLGLPVDHDDSHAAMPKGQGRKHSFALLVHGSQTAGSRYAKITTRRNCKKAAQRKAQAA